jgi:hypothetical protein
MLVAARSYAPVLRVRPAAAKQDDPATDALNTIGAVEDMKDFANNKTGGDSGANDNTNHQRGRVVRRR